MNKSGDTTGVITIRRENRAIVSVVACGYRQVLIRKSGLSFPAWQVSFGHEHSSSSSSSRWRSKRDFWRLGRVVSKNQQQQQQYKLPQWQEAWRKLALAAPWRAPSASASSSFDDDDHAGTKKNNWKPNMTKGLGIVNQYLQTVEDLVCSKTAPAEVVLAWEEFCRPEDTPDLAPIVVLGDDENGTDHKGGTSSSSMAPPPVAATNDDAVMLGNALGQYFCSPANSRQLVECFWEHLLPHLQHYEARRRVSTHPAAADDDDDVSADRKTKRTTTTTESNYCLRIVEPSCGHGDIVQSLYPFLLDKKDLMQGAGDVSIVGIDLDATVLERCRHWQQEVEGQTPPAASSTHTAGSSSSAAQQLKLDWFHADFLQTRPSDNCFRNGGSSKSSGETTSLVAMIGGPPYSAGAGTRSQNHDDHDGDDDHGDGIMQRDLPLRFVQHAIDVWNAVVVAFVMPARCQTANFGFLPVDYDYQSFALEHDATFYFCGNTQHAVTQPSIIQCFWKRIDKEEGDD